MRRIYLDYNATTPIAPSVQQAMLPFLTEYFGNPSSSHALGRACQEAIEDARTQVAALIGADREEVVFTSGGTESNNLALQGIMMRAAPPCEGHLIISSVEHPAIVQPARFLQRMGYEVTVVPCNGDGEVEPAAVKAALRPDTVLVSVMHANNEVGTIQPIRQIAQICHEREVLVHTDAAQSLGKIRTYVDELEVDLLTIAGHKLYAPKGVGALYIRTGVAVQPVLHGAGHECGLRPGTENVASIVALGCASALALKGLDDACERLGRLRDRLLELLREGIPEPVSVNGEGVDLLPNTLSVNFPGVSGHELLARIPELCASTGSACHSGEHHGSPTLKAMGVAAELARGCVRLSVGWFTTADEVERAASLLLSAWDSLRAGG